MKFVVFKIDEEEYGIDIDYVKGIEERVDVVSMPKRPDYVLGIINLRGEVIPVFSIRRKFGKDEKQTSEARLIIVSLGDNKVAFKVDEVSKISDVEESQLHDLPTVCMNEDTKYIKNITKINDKLVIMIDLDNIVDSQQLKELEKAVEESR